MGAADVRILRRNVAGDNARRTSSRKGGSGFTMVELAFSVALIIILLSVAFMNIVRARRVSHRLELDNIAKEIFITAQNHLSMAKSQGQLDLLQVKLDDDGNPVLEDGKEQMEEAYKRGSSVPTSIYEHDDASFFVHSSSTPVGDINNPDMKQSVLSLLLPFASIDEYVRTSGSYVIAYQPSTGTVLDVFYTDDKNIDLDEGLAQELLGDYRGDDAADDRLSFGDGRAIIGWHGGENTSVKLAELSTPRIKIHNDERLYVEVDNPKANEAKPNSSLRLVVEGLTSKAKMYFDLKDCNGSSRDSNSINISENDKSTKYFVVLDDVSTFDTTGDDHEYVPFTDLRFKTLVKSRGDAGSAGAKVSLGQDGQSFISGERLRIYAIVSLVGEYGEIEKSAARRVSSLFADEEADNKVVVANFRHLANLSYSVSGFSSEGFTATQSSDMSWITFCNGLAKNSQLMNLTVNSDAFSIRYTRGTGADKEELYSTAYYFQPVEVQKEFTYDGDYHEISEFQIATTGGAGLFADLLEGTTIKNLSLVNVSVAATGDSGRAGALAASAVGTDDQRVKIDNVIVRESLTDGDLQQYHADQGTSVSLKVSGDRESGGLVGSAAFVDFRSCASAVCATSAGEAAGGLLGKAHNCSLDRCYVGGHTNRGAYDPADMNVISTSAAAGGLVGQAEGTTIQYCYATASAQGATAGGLVGSTKGGSISTCYSLGLVRGSAAQGAFVGAIDGTSITGQNQYLAMINQVESDVLDADGHPVEGKKTTSALGPVANAAHDNVYAIDLDNGEAGTAHKTATQVFVDFANGANNAGENYAVPYDKYLAAHYLSLEGSKDKTVYPYRTVSKLAGSASSDKALADTIHYGDWPEIETLVINE